MKLFGMIHEPIDCSYFYYCRLCIRLLPILGAMLSFTSPIYFICYISLYSSPLPSSNGVVDGVATSYSFLASIGVPSSEGVFNDSIYILLITIVESYELF